MLDHLQKKIIKIKNGENVAGSVHLLPDISPHFEVSIMVHSSEWRSSTTGKGFTTDDSMSPQLGS